MSSDKKDYLKSYLRGYKPLYAIFYYLKDGEVKIFSGCKTHPRSEEEMSEGNFICNVLGGQPSPKEEVIEVFEQYLMRYSYE